MLCAAVKHTLYTENQTILADINGDIWWHNHLEVYHITEISLSILTAIDPGGSRLAGTRNISILDFTGAKDDEGGGDNWNYKTRKAPVKSSPPTNQHPVFIGRMPFLSPNQQCQSTEILCI